MKCSECIDILLQMPEGAVEPAQFKACETHLAQCADCRREREQLSFHQDILRSMRRLDDIDFNAERFAAETASRTMQAFAKPGSESIEKRSLFWVRQAAAVLLLIVGFSLLGAGLLRDRPAAHPLPADSSIARQPDQGEPLVAVPPEEISWIIDPPRIDINAAPATKGFAFDKQAETGWIGIIVREKTGQGIVTVEQVVSGGPGDKAGILPGDRITAFDNRPIVRITDLSKLLRGCEPGSVVDVAGIRDGQAFTVSVTIAVINHL